MIKKLLIAGAVVLLVIVGIIWNIFSQTFEDTSTTKADFIVSAIPFIQEFKKDKIASNKKYAEKIITVNGRITETEAADSTINVKMTEETSGDYVIFAFQQQDMDEVKKLKEGDSVSIKGSCSGGTYSDILETTYITFKRSSLIK